MIVSLISKDLVQNITETVNKEIKKFKNYIVKYTMQVGEQQVRLFEVQVINPKGKLIYILHTQTWEKGLKSEELENYLVSKPRDIKRIGKILETAQALVFNK